MGQTKYNVYVHKGNVDMEKIKILDKFKGMAVETVIFYINNTLIPAIEELENHKAASQYVLQLEGCINTLESRIAQLEDRADGAANCIESLIKAEPTSPINEKVGKECEHKWSTVTLPDCLKQFCLRVGCYARRDPPSPTPTEPCQHDWDTGLNGIEYCKKCPYIKQLPIDVSLAEKILRAHINNSLILEEIAHEHYKQKFEKVLKEFYGTGYYAEQNINYLMQELFGKDG